MGPGEAATDWWHRDHPTFEALAGFFTGLVFALVVPGVFAALLGSLFTLDTAEGLFPFVLLSLAVPIGLVARPGTRRFGAHMLLGIVTAVLVVAGVAALVLWVLVRWF